MAENAQHDQQQVADHKRRWQQMHQLEGLGILVLQDHTCLARMFHLTEERAELDAPFVIDESFGEETATVTSFENPGTQVDVFAVTHGCKAAQNLINGFLDAEVEAAGIELVHFALPPRMPPVVKNEVIE